MEGTDREEERKREEEKDGNNSGDVTEGKFFGLLLDPFSLLLRLFPVSFSLSSSPSLRVPVNKAICVQTLLWYSLPPSSCPLPLSFLPPSLLWGNKGPHSRGLDSLL